MIIFLLLGTMFVWYDL